MSTVLKTSTFKMKFQITTMISFTNGNVVNCSKITLDIPCSNRVCVMCVFDHKSENEICSTTAAAGKRVIHLQCCHRFQKGPTHLESPPLFFLPLSCWLATYKFSSRFNWYKKFGHNGMQWALKMWTNFSKEKVSVAVKGVGWLWCQKQWKLCSYLGRIMFQTCYF